MPSTNHFCPGDGVLRLVRPGSHACPQGLRRMRFMNRDLYQSLGSLLGESGEDIEDERAGEVVEEETGAKRRADGVAFPPERPRSHTGQAIPPQVCGRVCLELAVGGGLTWPSEGGTQWNSQDPSSIHMDTGTHSHTETHTHPHLHTHTHLSHSPFGGPGH